MTGAFFLAITAGAVWATVALIQAMQAPAAPEAREPRMVIFGIFAAATAALAVASLFWLRGAMRAYSTAASLGHVDLELDPAEVAPGGILRCRLHLPVERPIVLRRVAARFEVVERTTSKTVNKDLTANRDAESWVVRSDEVVFKGTEDRELSSETTLLEEMTVPADLPPSFYARNNSVHIRLIVNIADKAGHVDWTQQDTLWVVPGG